MSNNVLELIKSKDLIIPQLLFKNYRKLNITDSELIILIYLINNSDYNSISISEQLNIPMEEVITSINGLCEKVIIKTGLEKVNNINIEVINLDPLYTKLTNLIVESNSVNKDIYSYIEQKFGRTLSPIEYEMVSLWNEYPYNLVLKAIDDTVKKGIISIKYIDKILVEWAKKGYKDVLDVSSKKEINIVDTSLIDYDWLNDN